MTEANPVATPGAVSNEQWLQGVTALYAEYVSRKASELERNQITREDYRVNLAAFEDVCVGAIRMRFFVSRESARALLHHEGD